MYHFTDGGLKNVWLKNGYVLKKTAYGEAVAFHDLGGLTKVICMTLVKKPGKLTGVEFRYLRNSLLMSQKSAGKFLGCTEQAIAKWEKSGKVPKTSDFTMRLIYVEKNNGHEAVCATIDMLNLIDRSSSSKIIVREDQDKWTSNIETEQNTEVITA